MLKFKFLLWALAKLLQRAINNNPACAAYVHQKSLTFQIRTQGGAGRYFMIENGTVRSLAGIAGMDRAPQFTLAFRDAGKGFAVLSAKDGKDAFLTALHTGDLAISGDFIAVLWFQGLTDYLQPQKNPQPSADPVAAPWRTRPAP